MATLLNLVWKCEGMLFLCSFNRNFSELFHQFADFKSGFASTCAGSLVSLNYLCISILLKFFELLFDLVYKFFHKNDCLVSDYFFA
jgi:hypothetical protein